MQDKLQRVILGALLVRLQNARLGIWYRQRGGMIGRIHVQDVIARVSALYPLGAGAIVGERRPHAFHLRGEAERQRHRPNSLNFVEHQNSVRPVLRSEEDFADGEIGVRESNGGMARPNLDSRRLLVDVDGRRIVFHLGRNAQVTEYLPGKDPGFKRPVLLAEQGAARAGHGKGLLRHSVASDGELRRQQGSGVKENEDSPEFHRSTT